jgi:hypothetical protein
MQKVNVLHRATLKCSTSIINSIQFNSFQFNSFNPHCPHVTFHLALNLVQNNCKYHSHHNIFQYYISRFVLPRSWCMCPVIMYYGYQAGEKEKCNSSCSLLSLTNTFGLLSRPRPIILTKADAGTNKLIANMTPHSTSCIQHISTCLFHKKALQGSS